MSDASIKSVRSDLAQSWRKWSLTTRAVGVGALLLPMLLSCAGPASPAVSSHSTGGSLPTSAQPTVRTDDFVLDASGTPTPKSTPTRSKRDRLVSLNEALLLKDADTPLPNARLRLSLFDDVTYTATVDRVSTLAGDAWVWEGDLDGVHLGTITIVRASGAWIVKVAEPRRVLEISQVGPRLYRLIEVDQSGLTEG